MAITDPEQIKKIVCGNFDRSPELYERFESEHNVFRDLTLRLADLCGIAPGMTIIDAGCGTGSSTFPLADIVGPGGRVVGIDLSGEMLGVARERGRDSPNVRFIQCDASAMDEGGIGSIADGNDGGGGGRGVDAVLFTACIFLIPDAPRALAAARALLAPGGIAGMTWMGGVHDIPAEEAGGGVDAPDLLRPGKEEGLDFAPYGRTLVDVEGLPDKLRELDYSDVMDGVISVEMTAEKLRGFYGIPAQSTSLYPKDKYEERMAKLDSLLGYIEGKGVERMWQWWGWCTGRKML